MFAQRVLIDIQHLVVGQQPEGELVHLFEIAADQERRGEQRPQAQVGVLLVRREARGMELWPPAHLAHHQHVGIIPMSGAGELGPFLLLGEADAAHAFPSVHYVSGRAPRVGQLRPIRTVFKRRAIGEAVKDVAPCRRQCLAHGVGMLHVHCSPFILKVIHAPIGPLFRVLNKERHGSVFIIPPALHIPCFLIRAYAHKRVVVPGLDPVVGAVRIVAGRADMPFIGAAPGGRIDAELQAHEVDFLRERLHVGELRVGLNGVERPATDALPAVIDVDVSPAVVAQAFGHHGAGRSQHLLLADCTSPAIPTVPTKGRRQRDLVPDDDPEFPLRRAARIFGAQYDQMFPLVLQQTGDAAGGGIQLQTGGEILGGESHGTFSRGGDRVQKRRAGTHPEDFRAGDARGRRHLGRERGRQFRKGSRFWTGR